MLRWKTLLLIAILPFFSGAAALSHELLWTRRLVDLLGATDWVIGRVLGLFFLGLSLGGYLATLQARREKPAVLRLISTEVCIALLALPAAFLPMWTEWIWVAIGTDGLSSWMGSGIKLLLAVIVVFPPAIAMGFTLPLFIRTATDQGAEVASVGIWIYAFNTLGGVFGLWFASTMLLGWLGAQWTMLATCLANVCVALTLFSFYVRNKQEPAPSSENQQDAKIEKHIPAGSLSERNDESHETGLAVEPGAASMSQWNLLCLSFVSGFVVLSLEVLLLRLISLVVPSSYHTTSALLANVILILALSSGTISILNSIQATRNLSKSKMLVAFAFFMTAAFVCFCPGILFELTNKLVSIRYLEGLNGRTIDSVGHYWGLVFWLVASTGGLALFFSGIVFPSLLSISSTEDPAGKNVGRLLAVNGIGGLAGTELFNSLVIAMVGIYQAFVLLGCLLLLVVAAMLFKTNRVLAVGSILILSVVVMFGQLKTSTLPYLSPRTSNNFKTTATHFGKDGVWLVVEKPPSKSRSILVNNQYVLGGSGDPVNQRRQMTIPWILHPKAKSVCSLGLATGVSVCGLEALKDAPPVTAVELSHNVVEISKRYFQRDTDGFFDRQANRVIVEDARTYMAAATNQFDLIIGDLYRPYGTGEGRLFSVEHFENVRRALTEDGVFCQWLPIYQMDEKNWLTIAATFQRVFPDTLVVYRNFDKQRPVMGLIGRNSESKWKHQELVDRITNIPPELIARDPLLNKVGKLIYGVIKEDAFVDEPVNTLDNLRVEISAGNFWILKDLRKERPGIYEQEFLFGENFLALFNKRLRSLLRPPVR